MTTSTAPGLRQAVATRRLLLASHASACLVLPLGGLAPLALPDAGPGAAMAAWLAPAWTSLLAVISARLAVRLGHVGAIAPTGHFGVAVRDGAWAALMTACLVLIGGLRTGLATDWLLGAVEAGDVRDATMAARGFLAGVPFGRTPSDTVFLHGSLLATTAGAVLTLRGGWAFCRLLRGRPVRRASGPRPPGPAGGLARSAPGR